MFVDNSGVDIVLGVFPFVKELLCRGTMVNEDLCIKYYAFGKKRNRMMNMQELGILYGNYSETRNLIGQYPRRMRQFES